MRTIIIGAGMAGVAAAVKWRQAGLRDVAIYEKASSIGGTWRENTYPGVACDVPSHLYSYSFAPNPEWSHTFSPGPEIREYLEAVAKEHGVDRLIRFNSEVSELTHQGGQWNLRTNRGVTDHADVVVAATGVLHHPRYPDIPGMDEFAGPMFHSSHWDHDVNLAGTRVGVIGTGSSGVQIIGALAGHVNELRLFQRTAQWILPVPNPPIADEDRARFRQEPASIRALRDELYASFSGRFANAVIDAESSALHKLEEMCRTYLETSIADPELRERLRPTYRAACKRLVVSPTFYEALQRPGAQLVTDPILRIEQEGVRTDDGTEDGLLHRLDALVLATGFRVDRFLRPIEVKGRDGVSLDDAWVERPSAYLSVSVPEFPNLFLLNGPNGPVGNFSLIDVAEAQIGYILQLVHLLGTADGGGEISATYEAAERFESARVEAAKRTVWATGCRSWYLDDRGIPAAWPWTMHRFVEAMSRPDLADYDIRLPA
ncbi:MAG TPA: NAD(P)/FAD-dependent oxidoreductase [Acidimicrobiales bacterium]|nr:NAD(P)/FAD-dependent oxidoreductase [Acidimicrobiales bacterium]